MKFSHGCQVYRLLQLRLVSPLTPLLPEAGSGTEAEAMDAEVELAQDGTKTRIRIWKVRRRGWEVAWRMLVGFDWFKVGLVGSLSLLLLMFVSFFGLFVWVVWHVVLKFVWKFPFFLGAIIFALLGDLLIPWLAMAQPWIYGYLEVQGT